METRRGQTLAFVLGTAILVLGCDPENEPDDEPGSSSSSGGMPGSGSDETSGSASAESSGSTSEGEASTGGEATVCERQGIHYAGCFPRTQTVAEAIAWCNEHTAWLAEESQECADTYLVWADCISQVDCSEFETRCLDELVAHASLQCLAPR